MMTKVDVGCLKYSLCSQRMAEELKDVSRYPDLFAELACRGWSDDHLEKLAGKNLIRVFTEVEKVLLFLI